MRYLLPKSGSSIRAMWDKCKDAQSCRNRGSEVATRDSRVKQHECKYCCGMGRQRLLLTDYFATAVTRPTGMPYFLQRYKPQQPATEACEDGTGGGSTRESLSAISGPSTSHGNQRERSAVNKTYTVAQELEVLQCVHTHSEAEAAHHSEIPDNHPGMESP